jgi:hypothetical protein
MNRATLAVMLMVGAGAAACSGAREGDVDGSQAHMEASKFTTAAELKTVTESVFGDTAPDGITLYFMAGTDSAGAPCSIKLRRNENDSVVPGVGLVLEPLGGDASKAVDVSMSSIAQKNQFKVSQPTATSLKVETSLRLQGRESTELTFDSPTGRGLAHLTGVAIQSTENVVNTTHESACNGAHEVLTLTEAQGDALAAKAKAAYKKSTGKNFGTAYYVNQCSLASATRLECTFDGTGRADSDVPGLQATFAIEDGTVGDVADVKRLP